MLHYLGYHEFALNAFTHEYMMFCVCILTPSLNCAFTWINSPLYGHKLSEKNLHLIIFVQILFVIFMFNFIS